METESIARGAAQGTVAAIVAVAASTFLVWALLGGQDPLNAPYSWPYLVHYGVGGMVFGNVLASIRSEEELIRAVVVAGICLYLAVAGTTVFSEAYLLIFLAPPVYAIFLVAAFVSLVRFSVENGQRVLAVWILGGCVITILVLIVVGGIAPGVVLWIDPHITGAEMFAEYNIMHRSSSTFIDAAIYVLGFFLFYAFYAPITFIGAAAGYGAGLQAVADSPNDE